MNEQTARAYRRHRRDGRPAKLALSLARFDTRPLALDFGWDGCDPDAAIMPAEDTAPFLVTVRILPDPDMAGDSDPWTDADTEANYRMHRANGMPRHAARLAAREDAERWSDAIGSEEGWFVELRATYAGREVARDGVGTSVGPDDDIARYAELDIIPDMLPELLDRARDAARAMAPAMMARADADRAAWQGMAR